MWGDRARCSRRRRQGLPFRPPRPPRCSHDAGIIRVGAPFKQQQQPQQTSQTSLDLTLSRSPCSCCTSEPLHLLRHAQLKQRQSAQSPQAQAHPRALQPPPLGGSLAWRLSLAPPMAAVARLQPPSLTMSATRSMRNGDMGSCMFDVEASWRSCRGSAAAALPLLLPTTSEAWRVCWRFTAALQVDLTTADDKVRPGPEVRRPAAKNGQYLQGLKERCGVFWATAAGFPSQVLGPTPVVRVFRRAESIYGRGADPAGRAGGSPAQLELV